MAGTVRTMDAQSLTRNALQAGDKLKQDVPSQYKSELKNIVAELTGRVDFVLSGQPPRTKSTYQALEASAQSAGYTIVRLDTGSKQPAARALFLSAGYREIPDYNRNPAASYWFEKRLTPSSQASPRADSATA